MIKRRDIPTLALGASIGLMFPVMMTWLQSVRHHTTDPLGSLLIPGLVVIAITAALSVAEWVTAR